MNSLPDRLYVNDLCRSCTEGARRDSNGDGDEASGDDAQRGGGTRPCFPGEVGAAGAPLPCIASTVAARYQEVNLSQEIEGGLAP